jgi:soluble lytic murein transglycosylase-like protein
MNNRLWFFILLGIGGLIAFGGGVALVYWKRSANAARFLPALHSIEDAWSIPRDLLARVAYQESHFRDDIINGTTSSAAGAQGIMQIVPKWHPDVNPLDPYAAITYAGRYLRSLYDQFGSWKLALAAYNWGPGNLAKYVNQPGKWPAETLNYVTEITKDVPVH